MLSENFGRSPQFSHKGKPPSLFKPFMAASLITISLLPSPQEPPSETHTPYRDFIDHQIKNVLCPEITPVSHQSSKLKKAAEPICNLENQ